MSNASSDFSRGFLSILSDKEFNRNRKTLCESKKITFHNSDYNWCIRCDKIFCTNCSLTHLLENQIGHTPIEEIFINKDKLDAIFEKEVKESLYDQYYYNLNLSSEMQQNEDNFKYIKEWLKKNNLNCNYSRGQFIGKHEDIMRLERLLRNEETKLQLPFKKFTFNDIGNDELKEIKKYVRVNKKKWKIDIIHNTVIGPITDKQEIYERFKIEEEEVECINLCEEPPVSNNKIVLFNRDNSVKLSHLCVSCAEQTLDYLTDSYYDGEDILFDRIIEANFPVNYFNNVECNFDNETNQYWPQVPLGQLLYCICNESNIKETAKVWFTSLLMRAIKDSGIVTCCPDHFDVMFMLSSNNIQCSKCDKHYCNSCKKWHSNMEDCKGETIIIPGAKKCPFCGNAVSKNGGCNHITCQCGKHWCYACPYGKAFGSENSSAIYRHMEQAHGGWYSNPF